MLVNTALLKHRITQQKSTHDSLCFQNSHIPDFRSVIFIMTQIQKWAIDFIWNGGNKMFIFLILEVVRSVQEWCKCESTKGRDSRDVQHFEELDLHVLEVCLHASQPDSILQQNQWSLDDLLWTVSC